MRVPIAFGFACLFVASCSSSSTNKSPAGSGGSAALGGTGGAGATGGASGAGATGGAGGGSAGLPSGGTGGTGGMGGSTPGDLEVVASADTWLDELNPKTNYGTISDLHVSKTSLTLLYFDLGTIASTSLVQSAKLQLATRDQSTCKTTKQLAIYEVLVPWEEGDGVEGGATWTQRTNVDVWPTPGAKGASVSALDVGTFVPAEQNTLYQIDLTSLVQGWIQNPATNAGLAITADPSITDGACFDSREAVDANHRPRLLLHFQ